MTQALPVPQEDFTPFLLRQAGLRASLLKSSFGLAADDWEDLRQDLALDCLRRLPNFDPARGDWRQFVHGVVRNHACTLASRTRTRPIFVPFGDAEDARAAEELARLAPREANVEDDRDVLDLRLDVRRALASLPEELQALAHLLSTLSRHAVRRKTGLTAAQLDRKIQRIRAAFSAAGFDAAAGRDDGGRQ